MATKVLDSWALMAFFKGEPAGEAVEALIHQAANEKAHLLLCVVNWGEIYYGMWRAGGKAAADSVAEDLSRLPVELVEAGLALSRQAAVFKATRKMSYADCYAAALAKVRNCELLTGDIEFKDVEMEIKIRWLNTGSR
jgi:uncharacterized protein